MDIIGGVTKGAELSLSVAEIETGMECEGGMELRQGANKDDSPICPQVIGGRMTCKTSEVDLEACMPRRAWKELAEERNCQDCEEIWRNRMREDCEDCGAGIADEDLEMCLLGLDVVGLFPAMKEKNSGRILREQSAKNPLIVKGFKWKEGARYIRIHKHLTGDLRKVSKFLPWRRKTGGVEPGITNEEVTKLDGDVEKQWVFPRCTPTVQEEKELIARCAEIATRTIFQNFSYKFAGKVYLQTDGGPIGARVTMCLARIVMHDWGEKYRAILTRASLRIALLSSYVDDVRQGTTCLRFGMRFDVVKLEFVWSMGAEEEDKNMRREIGESNNRRMSRICLPAINSINKDLEFTSEVPEDFEDGRLPTLDTNWWQLEDYTISHSYFEKAMRTPYVIMSKSAISDNSRYNILSNELVRRLSNMSLEGTTQDEKNEVVEHYIQQCKTSGYSRHETREGVVSGIKGWKRKHERRKRDGISFYRGARSTLAVRVKKK